MNSKLFTFANSLIFRNRGPRDIDKLKNNSYLNTFCKR